MTVPRLNPAGRFDPTALFHPTSIAVIGGDTEAGGQILANLLMAGFAGQVHTEIVDNVSLAVLALAPDRVGDAMTRLAEANCHAAIVPGRADHLAGHAARTGVRVLGANSFGLAVPRLKLNATRSHIPPPAGRLGLVSQSAALCRTVIDWAAPNGLGFSHIVGLGANDDIGFAMTLDWLSRDAGTGVILLDIREIKNHRQFLSAARAAARLRPVVAIRAGLRLLDRDGAAELSFEAGLRRAGVLCVRRLEHLLAAAETLSRARPARNDTLGIVSNALGPGCIAADSVLREGLRLQSGEPVTHVGSAELAGRAFDLAAKPGIGGVLVVHAPQGFADHATIAALCRPPAEVRAPVLVCAMGETTGALHRSELARAGVPVFATPDQAVQGFEHLARDRRNRDAARELPASTVLALDPERDWVRRRFDRARATGRLCFAQDDALAVLSAYGIPIVPTRFAAGPLDAAAAAAVLGYPAVVKLRTIAAPGERPPGSLMFDLHDSNQIIAAARILQARARRHRAAGDLSKDGAAGDLNRGGAGDDLSKCGAPGDLGKDGTAGNLQRDGASGNPRKNEAAGDIQSDGPGSELGAAAELVVQRHAGRARELSIRVSDDATFGPTIAFGPGGTTRETTDLAIDLPPLNLALAHGLIKRSRTGRMLSRPLRDRPGADPAAVAETLVRVSQLIVDFPEIAALDIPTLFADQRGVLAADAWLRLRGPEEPIARLAIAPYPAELTEHRMIGAERITIRPIRPEDAAAHGAFFSRLSPQDIRFRFFSSMRELSPEQTVRLTQVDYDREMAFVAVREATSDTVGVSRLACSPDGASGEFAVIVQADMKGRGLASHLMRRLIEWARSRGLRRIEGQVLADNAPMLGFVRHLGFTVHRMADDPEVMEVVLTL